MSNENNKLDGEKQLHQLIEIEDILPILNEISMS